MGLIIVKCLHHHVRHSLLVEQKYGDLTRLVQLRPTDGVIAVERKAVA